MSGQIVLGTGFFAELDASSNDFLGSASYSMGRKLEKAKDRALDELIADCIKKVQMR